MFLTTKLRNSTRSSLSYCRTNFPALFDIEVTSVELYKARWIFLLDEYE